MLDQSKKALLTLYQKLKRQLWLQKKPLNVRLPKLLPKSPSPGPCHKNFKLIPMIPMMWYVLNYISFYKGLFILSIMQQLVNELRSLQQAFLYFHFVFLLVDCILVTPWPKFYDIVCFCLQYLVVLLSLVGCMFIPYSHFQKAAKRKKLHAFKSKMRMEAKEVSQNKRQNAWQQFQTTKGRAKKVMLSCCSCSIAPPRPSSLMVVLYLVIIIHVCMFSIHLTHPCVCVRDYVYMVQQSGVFEQVRDPKHRIVTPNSSTMQYQN